MPGDSAPNRRGFDRQATAPPGHEQLKIDVFVGAVGVGLGPHGSVAPGEHAMRRAQGLPGVTVDGEAVGLPLADDLTAQALAGLLVMAVR